MDRSADRADEVRVEIEAAGGAASVGTVDVSDSHAVAEAAEATGSIDVLINNAGIVTGKNLLDTAEEDIRRTYEVNMLALYWTTRAFLPAMVARDNRVIVTVASAADLVGVAKQTDYSAVESGKQQLTLPPLIRMLPGLRVLPIRAFDRIMDTLCVNRTKDAFTGRRSQFLQQ